MKTVLNYLKDYFRHLDKVLPVICIGLTLFDFFLISSMEKTGFVNHAAVTTQIIAGVLGITAGFVVSLIDYKFLAKYWYTFAPIAVILQLLLFTPLGVKRDDDIAWLDFKLFTVQPSEILKFVFIITLSVHISKLGDKLNSPLHFLGVCAHALFPAGLILIQGDAGSALVFLFIFICMLFIGGISWKYLAAGVLAVPAVAFVAWNYIMKEHHRLRFKVLFDEELQKQEVLGIYYQQYLGKVALGSGQLKGLGFNADHYTYTSEIYNDFVFSYIGMTMGFIGCMCVMIALAAVCLLLLSDASGAQDKLGRLICVGVFSMMLFHCVVNIGMVLSVVPVIGIPLPFISQGGTSMLMMHVCVGLALSVSAHKKKAKHMFYTEK